MSLGERECELQDGSLQKQFQNNGEPVNPVSPIYPFTPVNPVNPANQILSLLKREK